MECRNFKDLLDSYLCEELAVETNHQMLSHAEHCPPCRGEMASRRNMRQALRRACSQDRMSDEACEKLRTRLRAEASLGQEAQTTAFGGWRQRWARFLTPGFAIPLATAVAVLAVGVSLYLNSSTAQALELSDALLTEAASDHRKCAPHFVSAVGEVKMPASVRDIDAAYVELDKVAASGAEGLRLHAAHVCAPDGRRFAHLVYTRGERLISLLVTERDGRALKAGEVPKIDAELAGMQEALREKYVLGAYQSAKHVVLVVSDLPKSENEKLARTLAMPVVEHLRRLDNQSAANLPVIEFQELIVSAKGKANK